MFVVDLALVIYPIHVDTELGIALPIGSLDIARRCFTDDDVAGSGTECAGNLVFLERTEPFRGMSMNLLWRHDAAPRDCGCIIRIERRDAVGIIGSVEALHILDPGCRILHCHVLLP